MKNHTKHLHIADAKGFNHGGLQLGTGDSDFNKILSCLKRNYKNISFIPEIWQGHKDDGREFLGST